MSIKDHEFMFEAIEKVRKTNEARRTIKEQLLADMGLASVQQLSGAKRIMLEERIDAILAGNDREYMLTEDHDLQELKDATVKSAIEKAQTKARAARRNSDSDAEYAYGSQAHRLKQALDRKKRRQRAEKYEPSAAKTRGIVARNKALEKHNARMKADSRGGSDDEETAAREKAWRNDPIRRRRMEQGK